MSKTVELARHLETLRINNMYKTDFYWTWDLSLIHISFPQEYAMRSTAEPAKAATASQTRTLFRLA